MPMNRRLLLAAIVASCVAPVGATSPSPAPVEGVGRRRRRKFSWAGMAGVGVAALIFWVLLKRKK
jgi:hypothetical protein